MLIPPHGMRHHKQVVTCELIVPNIQRLETAQQRYGVWYLARELVVGHIKRFQHLSAVAQVARKLSAKIVVGGLVGGKATPRCAGWQGAGKTAGNKRWHKSIIQRSF